MGGAKIDEELPNAEELMLMCAQAAEAPEQAQQEPVRHTEVFTVTAYCPCVRCCGKSNGITASGVKAVEGVTIAADTNKLPFGTRIIIDGNVYTVQDKGGAIKGNRIDIYFNTHQKALNFGRQRKEVTIILKGE